MKKKIIAAVAALVAFTPAILFAADKAEIEAIVEEYIKNHPEVIIKSVREYETQRRAEAQKNEMEQALANRVTVDVGSSPSKGPKNAKITIFEFSDFQCPYCARSQSTLAQLEERHKGNLRIVFKNLPLDFHQKAKPAARAALAAGKQGKFWEYKSKLMASLNEWNGGDENALFKKYAKELGLKVGKFEKDLSNPAFDKQIENDMAAAAKIGARGTPTFVVNGVMVRGAQPIGQFEKVIAKTLEK